MQELMKLEYGYDAFEGVIDGLTMETHYSKHLATYLANYNNLVAGTKYETMKLNDVLSDLSAVDEKIRAGVRNNGGGVYNHNIYFSQFKKGTELKDGSFKTAIESTFGSLDAMIEGLKSAGLTRFGSGWSWLVLDGSELKIISTPNQDTPLENGQSALIAIDVWEHAYYLSYQNRRAEYLDKIWEIINWDLVESKFIKAIK
ncbi:MAG: superoxide dismutase [Mycoplasmatales bacterium]